MRIGLILTVKKSVIAKLDYFGYKFAKFGSFLTCFDRKKGILYLWTNLIEIILVLFCSLFMLVSLYFAHKKLFSIIFTCLNALLLFYYKQYSQDTAKNTWVDVSAHIWCHCPRLREHQTRDTSEVCNHIQFNTDHKVDFNNPQILTHSPDKYKLLILESLFIQQLKPDLNLDSSSFPFHLFNT